MTAVTAGTLSDALAGATARLRAAGCDSPRLDAELLAGEALGIDRAQVLTRTGESLEPRAAERFEALVARRERREPVAYILGRKPFRRLELQVDPRVLIPRPDTEVLVEAALDLPLGARVVDVGTGSGAVALALKHERPDLRVTGTDVDADTLAVARCNAERLGLHIELRRADLLEGAGGPFDAVVANLPYVDAADHAVLAPEIRECEPRSAVVSGGGGLDVLRRLVSQLGETEFVALEVGLGQERVVAGMLRAAGYEQVDTCRDLAGIERVVVGRRRA